MLICMQYLHHSNLSITLNKLVVAFESIDGIVNRFASGLEAQTLISSQSSWQIWCDPFQKYMIENRTVCSELPNEISLQYFTVVLMMYETEFCSISGSCSQGGKGANNIRYWEHSF